LRILRLHERFPAWLANALRREDSLGPGLVGKMLAVFGVAALLTVVLATLAWLSFEQVVASHGKIVNEAIPAMESVQDLVHRNSRISAWLEQLQRAQSADETRRLGQNLSEQLNGMAQALDQLEQQPFARDLRGPMRATVQAMAANVQRQVEQTLARIATQQSESAALARQRTAVDALLRLSEFLVANASATTTANIANLYRLLDKDSQSGQLLLTLDRLIEVDIDAMERMSELQLLCSSLKTALDQLQAAQTDEVIAAIETRFAADLSTLKRRIQDLRDPSLQQDSLAQYKVLASAGADSPFALRRQSLAQAAALAQSGHQGSAWVAQFNQHASALATAAGKAIDTARTGSQRAVDRVFVGFLLVAALCCVGLFVIFWAVFRHHVVTRLKGMETAVRALSTGNYDISLTTSDQDLLAPLSHALEQVRQNVRERERLEQALRQHQEALESQVAERTAELKRTNQLLEHEVAEHAVARQQAEDANKAKNIFLGSLSHELRTPLSGVSGAVQLLQQTQPDARQREYLQMIDYANRTLLEIFEDMLSFSRIEAGKLDLLPEPFNLRETLDAMLSLQSVPAQSKGLALRCQVAPDVPPWLLGDRRKINQVLLNVIGNAIKFTDHGSVSVVVEAQDTTDPQRKCLTVAVVDTGIGIPESQCAEVFKPFFQVEETAHQRHGGTGLGLAICQRLIQAMGGDIRLSSAPGRGTCVTFRLELAVAQAIPTRPEAQPPPVAQPLHPLTVLVVEDDPINRLVCARYLELLQHRGLLAADGAQALEQLAQQTQAVDAILMDISLPGRSGLEVARDIRALAQGRWAHVPVIVMSAHLAEQTQAAQVAAGLAGFLCKPFTLDDLARVLGEVTQARPGTGVARPTPAPEDNWLDQAFLATEIDTLGAPMLVELLAMFEDTAAATLDQMATARQAGDGVALGKLAHRLHSAAANLGLVRVMSGTRELELAAGAVGTDNGHLADLLARLQATTAQSCEALRQHVLAQNQPG